MNTIKRSELRIISNTEVPEAEVYDLLGNPPTYQNIVLTPEAAQVTARQLKVQQAAAGKTIIEDMKAETEGKSFDRELGWTEDVEAE